MTLGQSAPGLWNTYGAATIAFLGFLFHGLLAYGAAQRTAGQREQQWQSDQEWKKKHSSEANLRDVAIAALQAMANSNEATVKGIQRQLVLIQTELHTLRARAMRAASAEAPRKPNNSAK
jgi:hypothetical protein